MANKTTRIDVRRTKASQKDMEKLAADLSQATKSVNELLKGFQDLSRLSASLRTKAAFGNQLGIGAYTRGMQQMEDTRARNTAMLGTNTGRAADNQERLLKAVQKELKSREGLEKLQRASELNTRKEAAALRKLTDQSEILQKQELARLKNGQAQLKIRDEMARRDALTAQLKDKGLNDQERGNIERERALVQERLRTLRNEARAAQRLETSASRRLETVQAEVRAAQERVKFERESERVRTRSVSSLSASAKDRERRAIAERLNLEKSLASMRKITDVEAVRTIQARSRDRLRIEENRGNLEAVRRARLLNSLAERRLRVLRQQAEAQRAANQPTRRQQMEQSRANSRERLFGDGGATLFAIQSGLIANYMLLNQTQNAMQAAATFTIDLDAALRNLQAIVRVTDTNMASLSNRLVDVSEKTKFTAVEVAEASVTLGQAGFSTDEIEDSIEAVTLLATATGTDLAKSVDIATSTLGVFNMESSQMSDVANVMTEAVNTSKLNIEKLTLGLQYSGNIAAQSGVSFKELTSALGAMANAGIRSGSTLGTGMRQVLIALQKPSKEFLGTLDRLGLTMDDVDLKSQGLYGALKNLRDAGFTAGDAIRSFEIRGAAAYNALSNNLDQMLGLQDSFHGTTAAMQANETQMRSLANQGRRMASILGSMASTGLEPVKNASISVLTGLGDLLEGFEKWDGALKVVTTGVAALGASLAVVGVTRLAGKLTLLVLGINNVSGAFTAATARVKGFSLASSVATTRALTLSTALRGTLALLASPIFWVGAGATIFAGLAMAMNDTRTKTDELSETLEKNQTAYDNSSGEANKFEKQITALDGTLESLSNRYGILQRDSHLLTTTVTEVQEQMSRMGKEAVSADSSVDDLIRTLRELRRETAQEYSIKIGTALQDVGNLRESAQQGVTQQFRENQKLGSYGLPPEMQAELAVLQDQNSTANQIATARARFSTFKNEITGQILDLDKSDRPSAVGTKVGLETIVSTLDRLIERANQTEQSLLRVANIDRQIGQEEARLRVANDWAQPVVGALGGSLTELNSNVNSRLRRGVNAEGAQGRLRQARGNQVGFERQLMEAQASLDNLVASGVITSPEVKNALQQQITEARGAMSAAMAEIIEAAGEAGAQVAKLEAADQREKLQILGKRFSEADSNGERAFLTQERLRQLGTVATAGRAEIRARGADDGSDPAVVQRELQTYNAGIDRQRVEIMQQMVEANLDRGQALEDENRQLQEQLTLQRLAVTHGKDSAEYAEAEAIFQERALKRRQEQENLTDAEVEAIRRKQKAEQGLTKELERQATLRELTDRQERLRDVERRRGQIQTVLAQASSPQERANAEYALTLLDEEENKVRAVKTRVKEARDAYWDLKEQVRTISFDQRGEAKGSVEELGRLIKAAEEKGLDLNELDLTQLETAVQRIANLFGQIANTDVGKSMRAYEQYYGSREMGANPAWANKPRQDALRKASGQGILDLIGVAEGTTHGPLARGYNTVLGGTRWTNGEVLNPVNMTLQEVFNRGLDMRRQNGHLYGDGAGSSAMGKYQIVGKTMKDLAERLGYDMQSTFFSPEVQDRMAIELLRDGQFKAENLPGIWEGLGKNVPMKMIQDALGVRSYGAMGVDSPAGAAGNDPSNTHAFNQMLNEFRETISKSEMGLTMGEVAPEQTVATMDEVLRRAREARAQREQSYNRLSALTSRTKTEEEQLTATIREHNNLSRFILRTEEQMVALKKKHGLIQLDLNQTVEQWKRENLNVAATLEQGVGSVLSSLQTGFATLFTDLTSGTKTAGEAFRGFAVSVVKSLQQVIAKLIAIKIMESILGSFGGTPGGTNLASQMMGMISSKDGGYVRKAGGGRVEGNLARDSKKHLLMPGEYVLRKSATDMVGRENLDRINAMGNRRVSEGLNGIAAPRAGSGQKAETNVWVVSPERQPVMGPNDVLVTVTDDLARGGNLKQLVRSVAMGEI